jgi:hypothetical protein
MEDMSDFALRWPSLLRFFVRRRDWRSFRIVLPIPDSTDRLAEWRSRGVFCAMVDSVRMIDRSGIVLVVEKKQLRK